MERMVVGGLGGAGVGGSLSLQTEKENLQLGVFDLANLVWC